MSQGGGGGESSGGGEGSGGEKHDGARRQGGLLGAQRAAEEAVLASLTIETVLALELQAARTQPRRSRA